MAKKQSSMAWKVAMKRIRHRMKLGCAWMLRRHADYRPLFVLGTGRSGSTLVVDYLRSLLDVECYSEVLDPDSAIGLGEHERSPARATWHIRRSLQSLRAPIRG